MHVQKYACQKNIPQKKCMSKKICISLVVWHPGTDTSEAGIGSEHSLLAQHFGWLYALEAIPKRYFCISFKLEAFYEIPFGFNCRNEATNDFQNSFSFTREAASPAVLGEVEAMPIRTIILILGQDDASKGNGTSF